MGFEIPEPYCWDETFRVFYENIDEQHRGLFKAIFNVAANRTDSTTLTNLVKVVKEHFTTEEAMMTTKNYTGLSEHKTVHADFVTKISTLTTPVDDATVNYAKEWLVNHIKGVDFKYKGKL
jgi:hemerythrin family non-heme iron protein